MRGNFSKKRVLYVLELGEEGELKVQMLIEVQMLNLALLPFFAKPMLGDVNFLSSKYVFLQ